MALAVAISVVVMQLQRYDQRHPRTKPYWLLGAPARPPELGSFSTFQTLVPLKVSTSVLSPSYYFGAGHSAASTSLRSPARTSVKIQYSDNVANP